MKKSSYSFGFIVIINLITYAATSQPQWKFHVAFEDATGARDTLWLIWDSTAHSSLPVDTGLGEGRVILNNNNFNVFTLNFDGDTTKTAALPFAAGCAAGVLAMNYQYPISLSWDSALFNVVFPWPHSSIDDARIQNDYFFSINNDPPLQAFNMLLANQATAPSFNWGSQSQFPMYFNIARHDTSYTMVSDLQMEKLKLYPNPAKDFVTVYSNDKIETIAVFSGDGKTEFTKSGFELNANPTLPIHDLSPGFYIIRILTFKNTTYYEKFIKCP